ncbi:eIF5-mimic protein 2-like [Mya arenaria]|uniref:eIF5-mimic protein 2-like n=1 Tax=Mya arenaria TaxID=6604 RepID=UPI0022E391E0|nr:eIF5-mimic protein 2-like [Mya arenaria]
MSQKTEKPSLSGQRLKTRKRDEKEKYDPTAFRDAVIQGLNETEGDLEQVSKFLDVCKLDYRRYSDVLFDVLFAGGQLAPGGSILEDPDQSKVCRTDICVFGCDGDRNKLKAYFDVFNKLLRRYKYLEKSFEESIRKLLVFLKGFTDDEQEKLAITLGIIFANGFCKAQVLVCLFEDHVVKEGIALRFATALFRSWLDEKDIGSVVKTLRASGIDSRLLELFPLNKRSQEAFVSHFKKEGLEGIVNFQNKQQSVEIKKELQKSLEEMMENDDNPKEIVGYLTDYMKKHELSDSDLVIHVWNTLMSQVEWNKKEELVAEQAIKHLKKYALVIATVARSTEAESKLCIKIQEYCYDNMAFMKVFQKILVLFYKTDVLSEDSILRWYNGGHSAKGKSVFLEQMKSFVEWLQNAEEESDEED